MSDDSEFRTYSYIEKVPKKFRLGLPKFCDERSRSNAPVVGDTSILGGSLTLTIPVNSWNYLVMLAEQISGSNW